MNYYNEFDPKAAAWLRELIKTRLIPAGDVDERSIKDVRATDLVGYTQCHFFAGIGGWSYALQLAGWPKGEAVWTGSCPCQPFSGAGRRLADKDPRHLWPDFRRLIGECSPATVFGEQVASADGRLWLAGVRTDLEALGYAVGAADLCAAGVSAPHIRQRLWWVADAKRNAWDARRPGHADEGQGRRHAGGSGERQAHGLGDADRYHGQWWSGPVQMGRNGIEGEITRGGRRHAAQWRVGPGIRIVAHGVPNRVGGLCGAGNAIVPQVAAEFIGAYLDTLNQPTPNPTPA